MTADDVYEEEIETSWSNVFSVWWLVFWRWVLGGALIGFVIGLPIGFFGRMGGMPPESIAAVSGAIGVVFSLIWGVVVVRMALRKQYRGFRVALVTQRG